MANEIAVRGGMLVDGTGAPAQRVDIGIRDGKVVEIAPTVRGATELDATGMVVAPGFIDIHTHYDPQVLWDATLSPSCWHGVTSVVAGNCGYSIAPTKPSDRGSLVRTLDKVEDMRVATLEAGIEWDFETYGQYLDSVRRRGTLLNFGGYVGHKKRTNARPPRPRSSRCNVSSPSPCAAVPSASRPIGPASTSATVVVRCRP